MNVVYLSVCVVFIFFLINILQFLVYRYLASLVKFVPEYFIVFRATVNDTINFSSDCYQHMETTDLWVLIL